MAARPIPDGVYRIWCERARSLNLASCLAFVEKEKTATTRQESDLLRKMLADCVSSQIAPGRSPTTTAAPVDTALLDNCIAVKTAYETEHAEILKHGSSELVALLEQTDLLVERNAGTWSLCQKTPRWRMVLDMWRQEQKNIESNAPPVDLFVPVGPASKDGKHIELQLLLRSAEKNVKGLRKVWTIGYRPDWLVNENHIDIPDSERNKSWNILKKLRHLLELDTTADVIKASDDSVFLRPVSAHTWTVIPGGALQTQGKSFWHRCRNRTADWLSKHGYSEIFYDTHAPCVLTREGLSRFFAVFPEAEWKKQTGWAIWSLYYNVVLPEKASVSGAVKACFERVETNETEQSIRDRLVGSSFIGYNNAGFSDKLREVLLEMFPAPSRFEKEAAPVDNGSWQKETAPIEVVDPVLSDLPKAAAEYASFFKTASAPEAVRRLSDILGPCHIVAGRKEAAVIKELWPGAVVEKSTGNIDSDVSGVRLRQNLTGVNLPVISAVAYSSGGLRSRLPEAYDISRFFTEDAPRIKTKVSVIIPCFRLDKDKDRQVSFDFVLSCLLSQQVHEIIVPIQVGPGEALPILPGKVLCLPVHVREFPDLVHKSELINAGVSAASGNMLWLHDADCWLPFDTVLAAVDTMGKHECLKPFSYFARLSSEDSTMFMRTLRFSGIPEGRSNNLGGGSLLITKRAFTRIGGYCESYVGWGCEDDDFGIRVAPCIQYTSLPCVGLHLYHKRPARDLRNPEYAKSRARLDARKNMSVTARLAEVQSPFKVRPAVPSTAPAGPSAKPSLLYFTEETKNGCGREIKTNIPGTAQKEAVFVSAVHVDEAEAETIAASAMRSLPGKHLHMFLSDQASVKKDSWPLNSSSLCLQTVPENRFMQYAAAASLMYGNVEFLCAEGLVPFSEDPAGKKAFDRFVSESLPVANESVPAPDRTAVIIAVYGLAGKRLEAVQKAVSMLDTWLDGAFLVFLEGAGEECPLYFDWLRTRENCVYVPVRMSKAQVGCWQKEAMYNKAVEYVPEDRSILIFIDGDFVPVSRKGISFTRMVETCLQACPTCLLQPYSFWKDTEDPAYQGAISYGGHRAGGKGSPGGAIAMTRDVFDAIEGFDVRAFAGGGDGLFILTKERDSKYVSDHTAWNYYKELVSDYRGPVFPLVSLSWNMVHFFHGKHRVAEQTEGLRAYGLRNACIDWDGRKVNQIIRRGDNGLIEFVDENDYLREVLLRKSEFISEEAVKSVIKEEKEKKRRIASAFDQVWWVANWNGGMGSAMRGAVKQLEKEGLRILTLEKDARGTGVTSPVWVLGGLPITLAEKLRAASGDRTVVMQTHSPWFFLSSEKTDYEWYLQGLDMCKRDKRVRIAHVAEREYRDACYAFGEEFFDFVPAVYEGTVTGGSRNQKGPIVLAHNVRLGKNISGQLFAGALAAKALSVPLVWSVPPDMPGHIKEALLRGVQQVIGIDVCVKDWTSQEAFRQLCASASVGLCATWTDAYCQVACDFMAAGVPVLASYAQWFCPPEWIADPDDAQGMSRLIIDLVVNKAEAEKASEYLTAAQEKQIWHLKQWAVKVMAV